MGTKTVIDFDDYDGDKYESYTGDDPRPGWYTFELQTVAWYGEDKDTLRWILVIADGPYAGWPGMVFGNMDTTKWKNQEMARAIQGGQEKKLAVDFDSPKEVAALVKRAKRVRGKVAMNTNPATQETRLQLRKVAPLLEDASTTRKGAPADDLAEEPDELNGNVDDVVEGGDEDYTEEELSDMTLADLKAILKDEFDYTAKQLRAIKDEDTAIDAILAAQEEDEDDPEAEGDDETDSDFDDDFATDEEPEQEEEPEPEPAPRRRRGAAAATKAAPAKAAAPAKKAAAPAQRTTRRRRA